MMITKQFSCVKNDPLICANFHAQRAQRLAGRAVRQSTIRSEARAMTGAGKTRLFCFNRAAQVSTDQTQGRKTACGVDQQRRNIWNHRARTNWIIRGWPKVKFGFRECFLSSRVSLENDQIRANLPDRSQVYRMAADCGLFPRTPSGTPAEMGSLANYQRYFLCRSYRLPMAHVAKRFSSLADRLRLFSTLEATRLMGTYE